jgi:hypothetical protein
MKTKMSSGTEEAASSSPTVADVKITFNGNDHYECPSCGLNFGCDRAGYCLMDQYMLRQCWLEHLFTTECLPMAPKAIKESIAILLMVLEHQGEHLDIFEAGVKSVGKKQWQKVLNENDTFSIWFGEDNLIRLSKDHVVFLRGRLHAFQEVLDKKQPSSCEQIQRNKWFDKKEVTKVIWDSWSKASTFRVCVDEKSQGELSRYNVLGQWDERLALPENTLPTIETLIAVERNLFNSIVGDIRFYEFRVPLNEFDATHWLQTDTVVREGQILPDVLLSKEEKMYHLGRISGLRDGIGLKAISFESYFHK